MVWDQGVSVAKKLNVRNLATAGRWGLYLRMIYLYLYIAHHTFTHIIACAIPIKNFEYMNKIWHSKFVFALVYA